MGADGCEPPSSSCPDALRLSYTPEKSFGLLASKEWKRTYIFAHSVSMARHDAYSHKLTAVWSIRLTDCFVRHRRILQSLLQLCKRFCIYAKDNSVHAIWEIAGTRLTGCVDALRCNYTKRKIVPDCNVVVKRAGANASCSYCHCMYISGHSQHREAK